MGLAKELKIMDERQVIHGLIFKLANRLQRTMDKKMENLSSKQWFVLTMMDFFDPAPLLGQLAEICDSSHQNTRQIVLKLEEKGYVRTEKDSKDDRAMRIYKTSKCKAWEKKHQDIAVNFIDTMYSPLTKKEISDTCTNLMKLYNKLGELDNETNHA
jgi:DNA-binding MarR family transcriptional regulator